MPGRPAGHPPSIGTFPSSTDFGYQPHACRRKPARAVIDQRALEVTGLPQRLSEYPAQPLWVSAEPTRPSAAYRALKRFPGRDRTLGTASPQRLLGAEDDGEHAAVAFAH